MVKHFKYDDDWRSAILNCQKCGWKGTFIDGDVEIHREFIDSSCPVCDELLAILPKGKSKARRPLLAAEFPDLEGPSLTLGWDFVKQGSDHFTVIRHGEKEIWREPAFYEGFERFEEVVKVLQEKYGTRLADVVPTPASEYYLYGDVLSAPDAVEAVRRSIRESHRD